MATEGQTRKKAAENDGYLQIRMPARGALTAHAVRLEAEHLLLKTHNARWTPSAHGGVDGHCRAV